MNLKLGKKLFRFVLLIYLWNFSDKNMPNSPTIDNIYSFRYLGDSPFIEFHVLFRNEWDINVV